VLLSGGLISLTSQVRSAAEENVYQSSTLALGQAYVEQLRSLDFPRLSDAAAGTADLPLVNSAGLALTNERGSAFTNGDWARETVMLDEDATGAPRQPMTFRFRPVLVDLATASSGAARGVEITVFFETTYNYGSAHTYRASLRTVRSDVPSY